MVVDVPPELSVPGVDRHAVFEALPTPYVVMSPSLHVLDMNAEYLVATGRTREGLLGRHLLEAFPPPADTVGPDGRSELQISLEKVAATGQPDTLPVQRYPIADSDGVMRERHWLAVHVPVTDATGEVVAVVQRTEDITEFALERARVEELAAEHDQSWKRRAERVEADLYHRARELADALAAKDAAARRVAVQAEVALALSNAATVTEIEDIVVGRGLSVLGCDGGGISLIQDDGFLLVINAALGDILGGRRSAPPDSPLPGCVVARTGEPLLLPDRAAGLAWDHDVMAEVYAATDRDAWAVVPLVARGQRLGALCAAWVEARQFDAESLELLDGLAAQCAQALLRVRTAQQREEAAAELRQLAESLQQALLTPPPQRDDMEIAVRYRPAAHHAQVGGDWYDAFVAADGDVVLVIGDVVGHDSAAAARMGQVRGLLRSLAYDSDRPGERGSPARVLTRLEHAAVGLAVETLATAVVARVETTPTGHRLRFANAGHPPPLLVRPDGRVEVLDVKPDVLLGVAVTTERRDHVIDLPEGATLLFYTDGLVERRDAAQEVELETLAAVLGPLAGVDLERLCDALLVRLAEGAGEDDTALLAVRVGEAERPDRQILDGSASRELPSTVEAPSLARDFLDVETADLPRDVRDNAGLVVSELVSNAVRHGAEPVTLQVRHDGDVLYVGVHDCGPRLPVVSGIPGNRSTSGRGLLITAALSERWGVLPDDDGTGKAVWAALTVE